MWDATTVRSEAGGLDQVQLRELVHGGKLGPVEAMQGFLRAWREGVWTPGAFTEPASNRRGNFAPHLAASWILMGLKNRSGGAVSDTSHTAIALQLQAGMDPAEIRVRGDSNLAADLENGRASYLQSPVRVERGGAWPEDDSGSARLFTPEELLETLRSYELEQLRRDGPLLPNPNVTVHGDLADDVPADTVAVFYESPPGANYAETIQELTRGLATRVGGSSQVVGAQHDGATADGYRARVRLLTGAADRAPQGLTTSAGTWARVTPGNDVEEGDEKVGCVECGDDGGGGTGGSPGTDGGNETDADEPVNGGGTSGVTPTSPDPGQAQDEGGGTGDAGTGCTGPMEKLSQVWAALSQGQLQEAARAAARGRLALDPTCWPLWAWAALAALAWWWWQRRGSGS